MEMLNKIHLKGVVGSCSLQNMENGLMAKFTMATCRTFKNKSGEAVVETTWHNVSACEGAKVPATVLDSIAKGDKIEVTGRIHVSRLRNENDDERLYTSVIADSLSLLSCDEPLYSETYNSLEES